ncbi:MAG: hypothetical protein IKO39_06005 [Treponema sp.]|nr:hypothetical protein [Treponema sp.]
MVIRVLEEVNAQFRTKNHACVRNCELNCSSGSVSLVIISLCEERISCEIEVKNERIHSESCPCVEVFLIVKSSLKSGCERKPFQW